MARKEISVIISGNYSPNAYHITLGLGMARLLFGLVIVLALLMVAALGLWVSGAYRLIRLASLEKRNRQLEQEFTKLVMLKDRLHQLEEQSRKLAGMLGVELTPAPVNWDSVMIDSASLPSWLDSLAWGSHPVPVLVPVPHYRLSRQFGPEHEAVDLATKQGAPVRAAADGVVTGRGTSPELGKYLILQHGPHYETYYGHLAGWNVRFGDTVRVGQTLGTVGMSGKTSAPHLHFEIRKDGKRIDPASLIHF